VELREVYRSGLEKTKSVNLHKSKNQPTRGSRKWTESSMTVSKGPKAKVELER
jgi:hypothetical protein